MMTSCGASRERIFDIGLGIDRIALLDQAAHHAFRVGALQQRTGRPLAHPAHQHVEIGLEPDRDGAVADQRARLRLDEGAAAGGDDPLALADQPGEHATLAVAEIGFAMMSEDFRDGQAMGGFDLVIRIDEGQAKPVRQPLADRRLARAHHADEDQRAAGQTIDDRLRALVAQLPGACSC